MMNKTVQSTPSLKEVHKMQGALAHRLFNEPLAISTEAIPQLLLCMANDKVGESMAAAHRTEQSASFQVESDRWGNPLPAPYILDGIAVLPLFGPIIKGAGNIGKWYGMADLNDFRIWLAEAEKNPEVKGIVFHVDSPGGFTTGVQEIAAMITRISTKVKPTMAYTEGSMGSAAFWIGGSATFVYGTPSSIVGSIGTFLAIQDASKFYESMGVKIHVFRSGEYKGIGEDGVSEKQAAYLQERVSKNAEEFKSAISSRRSSISRDDMNGQSYFGSEAAQRGFLGGLVEGFEQAVAKFRGHITQ